jgi:hypothetical protein
MRRTLRQIGAAAYAELSLALVQFELELAVQHVNEALCARIAETTVGFKFGGVLRELRAICRSGVYNRDAIPRSAVRTKVSGVSSK